MSRRGPEATSPKLSDIKITLSAVCSMHNTVSCATRRRPLRAPMRRASRDLMEAQDRLLERATPAHWSALVAASRRFIRADGADRAADRAKYEQQDAVAGTSGGAA
jgi:hypothetical protein